jgi:SNF2 family DNA or RNA helicase
MKYKFKMPPYEHQLTALRKGWNLDEFAYFMDMGTGKSKVLIDNFSVLYDKGYIGGVLIIAPKGVYRNWSSNEIPTHMPEHVLADICIWQPNHTQKFLTTWKKLFEDNYNLKIFLMNIEAFSTRKGVEVAEKFLLAHSTLMAIDESTTIKSKNAKRTKSIVKLGKMAKYRRIMTGSPITKSPMDLYTQCEFLNPELLGHKSFYSFQYEYAIIKRRNLGSYSFNQIVGYKNLKELNGLLDNFSYRVRKQDCLDLPDKVYTKRVVELTPEQAKMYSDLKKIALGICEEGTVTPTTILTQLLRLQQVCSGHVKLDDGTIKTFSSAKIKELEAVVEEINGKAIIWANFTHDIESIVELLIKMYGEDSVVSYYGATSTDQRDYAMSSFQNPDSPVRFFVGQPRTGGYGLTLTQASTVIYYSNSYDLEVRLQSEDRAHRIGQVNKVTYIDIIAEKTVDEKVLQALRSKIDIASVVLQENVTDWIV